MYKFFSNYVDSLTQSFYSTTTSTSTMLDYHSQDVIQTKAPKFEDDIEEYKKLMTIGKSFVEIVSRFSKQYDRIVNFELTKRGKS